MYSTNTSNNYMVPHAVTEDIKYLEMKLSAKFLYQIHCKLANRYADSDGWYWRSIPQLVKDTGMDRKTVIEGNKILKKNEFIDIKSTFYEHSKKRTYNSYRLNGFRFKSGDKNGT
jgi:hypothetical protein